MTLNHSKSIKAFVSLLGFPYQKKTKCTVGMQQFKMIYCDLILCTTPACFSTFFQATVVLTLAENS